MELGIATIVHNIIRKKVKNRGCLSDIRGELFLMWRATRQNEEINIVITDIKLPGTDGIKFTNNIKKKYQKYDRDSNLQHQQKLNAICDLNQSHNCLQHTKKKKN